MENFNWKTHLFQRTKPGPIPQNGSKTRQCDCQPAAITVGGCTTTTYSSPFNYLRSFVPGFPEATFSTMPYRIFFHYPTSRLFLHWKIVSPWIKLECSAHMAWKRGLKWDAGFFLLLFYLFFFIFLSEPHTHPSGKCLSSYGETIRKTNTWQSAFLFCLVAEIWEGIRHEKGSNQFSRLNWKKNSLHNIFFGSVPHQINFYLLKMKFIDE